MLFIQPNTSSIRFRLLLTHLISTMAGRALIDGAATVRVVLRDMRRDLHVAQFSDEVVGVITLVRSERDAVRATAEFRPSAARHRVPPIHRLAS